MPPTATKEPASKLVPKSGFSLQISTVSDLMQLANAIYQGGASSLPGISRPENVFRIILSGNEIGLSPAQSVDTIMLCNGKLTVYGDGAMALIMASGLLAKIKETIEGTGDDRVATAVIQRSGMEEETFTYSVKDAVTAGLWGKKDNWKKDPEGMLTWRCRSRWQRGRFADVLRGLNLYEVAVDDATPIQITQVETVRQLPASTTTATTDQVTDAVVSPPVEMVTEDQLREIAVIKNSFVAGIAEKEPEAQRAKWVELVAGYGVESARQFTREKATQFIEVEGKKHDPFGHPSSTLKT